PRGTAAGTPAACFAGEKRGASAAVPGPLCARGLVLVRFGGSRKAGRIAARIGEKGVIKAAGEAVLDEKGRTVVRFGRAGSAARPAAGDGSRSAAAGGPRLRE